MAKAKPDRELKRIQHELDKERQQHSETRTKLQISVNQLDAIVKQDETHPDVPALQSEVEDLRKRLAASEAQLTKQKKIKQDLDSLKGKHHDLLQKNVETEKKLQTAESVNVKRLRHNDKLERALLEKDDPMREGEIVRLRIENHKFEVAHDAVVEEHKALIEKWNAREVEYAETMEKKHNAVVLEYTKISHAQEKDVMSVKKKYNDLVDKYNDLSKKNYALNQAFTKNYQAHSHLLDNLEKVQDLNFQYETRCKALFNSMSTGATRPVTADVDDDNAPKIQDEDGAKRTMISGMTGLALT